ncbi:MAG: gamma-glutamyl-gamma-aminobutyrate hydrolase family protein [Alphaproteobacteria bacterium]
MIYNKPIIGITLDSEKSGEYSDFPWYALRENYGDIVVKYGGIPIFLPHETSMAENYINLIDGLIITGGDFDIDPKYWGEEITSEKVVTKNRRTEFEFKITKLALDQKIPILGICAGEQLLNVIFGGSLIQHIPDSFPNALNHEQPKPKNIPWHKVIVEKDSLLYNITNMLEFEVNSTHHQAVDKLGKNIKATAHATDGIIEAIELNDYPFCLGVQWHPEYDMSEVDGKILKAFIESSKK